MPNWQILNEWQPAKPRECSNEYLTTTESTNGYREGQTYTHINDTNTIHAITKSDKYKTTQYKKTMNKLKLNSFTFIPHKIVIIAYNWKYSLLSINTEHHDIRWQKNNIKLALLTQLNIYAKKYNFYTWPQLTWDRDKVWRTYPDNYVLYCDIRDIVSMMQCYIDMDEGKQNCKHKFGPNIYVGKLEYK